MESQPTASMKQAEHPQITSQNSVPEPGFVEDSLPANSESTVVGRSAAYSEVVQEEIKGDDDALIQISRTNAGETVVAEDTGEEKTHANGPNSLVAGSPKHQLLNE